MCHGGHLILLCSSMLGMAKGYLFYLLIKLMHTHFGHLICKMHMHMHEVSKSVNISLKYFQFTVD